jgi:hypothetical protein
LLDDAVAAFLEHVPERAFDEPFMALLRAEGYSHVSLSHGQSEFGKDIVARRDRTQWAFQSKAGNINQRTWGQITGQLDELRLSNLAGPDFDPELPRKPVLVVTGRLVGNAPLLAAEYQKRAEDRGEPVLAVWNRDTLLSRLSGNPDAVMRGAVDGGFLTILGSIAEQEATMDSVEQFARRWDSFPAGQLGGRGVIEASIVCSHLQQAGRLDLACHLALSLIRATWANDQASSEAELTADAAGLLFEAYARELWTACDDSLLKKRGVLAKTGFSAWAMYPVMCSRIAEILGLLALRAALAGEDDVEVIAEWLAKFVYGQPGVAHHLGDRFAVSLIPPILVLQRFKPRAAKKLLTQSTVWLCTRYERGSPGLAPWTASPIDEIERIYGHPFEHIRLRGKRVSSHLASVACDLAALCGYRKLYADIRNDHLAVELVPVVLRCPDTPDQYVMRGEANRWEHNPDYPDELPREGRLGPPHHKELDNPRALVRKNRAWDLLAISASLRDRHFVDAIEAVRTGLT